MALTEVLTTNISTESQKLYESAFLAEQSQTNGSIAGSKAQAAGWRPVFPASRRLLIDEPAIIRFYEDVIADLQRELAKYKALAAELSKNLTVEIEGDYTPREKTQLPPDTARLMRASTQPASSMTGHEI
jgi:hypothetical protein